jgi:N utilization substance protein B
MKTRRDAREWALRVLYAHELSRNPISFCIEDIVGTVHKDATLDFCVQLVTRVADKDAHIDHLITPSLDKWDLNRIAVIDHLILRMGICEFLYFADIPYKVTINECIELAKSYSTAQSGRFVNGILDAVSLELRKQVAKPEDEPAGVNPV